jgi:predicted ester cyclase
MLNKHQVVNHLLVQAAVLTILVFSPSVARAQQSPPLPKGPEQVARWVVDDVWNKGDIRLVNQMFAPGAALHYRGQTYPLTPESGIKTVQTWRNAFPDFHFTLEDMIVQGNKVVLRIPFTGTHLGAFWGLEPTGKKINVTETLILRIEQNKIAEMWEDYDEYGMRIQLGLLKSN